MSQFVLPKLDYEMDALAPAISKETLEFHYGKHHQTYINNLNSLIKGTMYEAESLREIIKTSQGPIFNNAAQTYNHAFYWKCLTPNGGGQPTGALLEAIVKQWGSFEGFVADFSAKAANNFGSGWTWLVKRLDGQLLFDFQRRHTSDGTFEALDGYRRLGTRLLHRLSQRSRRIHPGLL